MQKWQGEAWDSLSCEYGALSVPK